MNSPSLVISVMPRSRHDAAISASLRSDGFSSSRCQPSRAAMAARTRPPLGESLRRVPASRRAQVSERECPVDLKVLCSSGPDGNKCRTVASVPDVTCSSSHSHLMARVSHTALWCGLAVSVHARGNDFMRSSLIMKPTPPSPPKPDHRVSRRRFSPARLAAGVIAAEPDRVAGGPAGMPAFTELELSDEKLNHIVDYLKTSN